jgi:hypothetical protein
VVVLGEDSADEGGGDAAPLTVGMGQQIAGEVDAAALPGGIKDLGDGGLDPFVGIRGDQLHTPQAMADQGSQKVGPEGLGFRVADGQAEEFAASVGIGPDSDGDGDGHDASTLTHFEVGCVDPQVAPLAIDGRLRKALTFSSSASQRRLTWLLEMPVMPSAWTRSSTERVQTLWM